MRSIRTSCGKVAAGRGPFGRTGPPRRLLRVLASCAVLWLTLGLPARAETRRALLVGIDRYSPPPGKKNAPEAGRTTWMDLEGAVNDVEAFRDILVSRFGFKPADVRILVNSEATRDNILKAFRKHLIEPSSGDDVALFYYAGHGSQVRNSKSDEPDGMDESLVPADSNRGAPDLRDKEMAPLYNELLDKTRNVVAIFDSCHSGSNTRGLPRPIRTRSLPADPRDVKDASKPKETPEQKGLLVLSAAQDYQFASEAYERQGDDYISHGAFSLALTRVLRTMRPDEPVDRLFLRVKALLQSTGIDQEPVLSAPATRLRWPLFGNAGQGGGDKVSVAVAEIQNDRRVILQGGAALGLAPDGELVRLSGEEEDSSVRLQIVQLLGASRSSARVIKGKAEEVQAGDLFVVTRWAPPAGQGLRVWADSFPGEFQDLLAWATLLYKAVTNSAVAWVNDPTLETPTHLLTFTGSSWNLATGGSPAIDLGAHPAPADVLASLAKEDKNAVRLYVQLPCLQPLCADIQSQAFQNTMVEWAGSPDKAHYLLAGRLQGGSIEYAWIMPNRSADDADTSPMPARTDWIPAAADPAAGEHVLARLKDRALRLARIQAWQLLEPPPDNGSFPYELALKNTKTGVLEFFGPVYDGESHELVLKADESALEDPVEPRYVYVFSIDPHGTASLLYPPRAFGNAENRFPTDPSTSPPAEIVLGSQFGLTIGIGEPFGLDTYILLTTAEALPDPGILDSEGVRTRSAGASGHPLEQVLLQAGTGLRGAPAKAIPSSWSLKRSPFISTPARGNAP